MSRMLVGIVCLTLSLFLVFDSSVDARLIRRGGVSSCNQVVVRQNHVVHANVVHHDTPVVVTVLVPVVVPATIFQYMPAVQPQSQLSYHTTPQHVADGGPPELVFTSVQTPIPTKDYTQQVAQILSNKCASCHTSGAKVSGDVILFTKNEDGLFFTPNVQRQLIVDVVSGSRPRMPPSANRNPNSQFAVKATDVEILKKWAVLP